MKKRPLLLVALSALLVSGVASASTKFLLKMPLRVAAVGIDTGGGHITPVEPDDFQLSTPNSVNFGRIPLYLDTLTTMDVQVLGIKGVQRFTASPQATGEGLSILDTDCPASLEAGESCTIYLSWEPSTEGSIAGAVTVFPEGAAPVAVPITANAYNPLSLNPPAVLEAPLNYPMSFALAPYLDVDTSRPLDLTGLSWSATNLPGGFTLNSATGVISGQTAVPITQPISVFATLGANTVSGGMSFEAAGRLLNTVTDILPNGCAVRGASEFYCWGPQAKDIGYGTGQTLTVAQLHPLNGRIQQPPQSNDYYNGCGVLDGDVKCWTLSAGYGHPPPIGNVKKVVNWGNRGCALTLTGEVKCWSWKASNGEFINGVFSSPLIPALTVGTIAGLGAPATDVTVEGATACALLVGGSVKCWGAVNDASTTPTSTRPVMFPITGMPSVKSLAGGSCALGTDNQPYCWGGFMQSSTVTGVASNVNGFYAITGGLRSFTADMGTVCMVVLDGSKGMCGVPYSNAFDFMATGAPIVKAVYGPMPDGSKPKPPFPYDVASWCVLLANNTVECIIDGDPSRRATVTR